MTRRAWNTWSLRDPSWRSLRVQTPKPFVTGCCHERDGVPCPAATPQKLWPSLSRRHRPVAAPSTGLPRWRLLLYLSSDCDGLSVLNVSSLQMTSLRPASGRNDMLPRCTAHVGAASGPPRVTIFIVHSDPVEDRTGATTNDAATSTASKLYALKPLLYTRHNVIARYTRKRPMSTTRISMFCGLEKCSHAQRAHKHTLTQRVAYTRTACKRTTCIDSQTLAPKPWLLVRGEA